MKLMKELPLAGKKVLLRVDFNVPQDANGKITDNSRIVAALPTIKYLLSQNCKIIVMSHLGRPKGITPKLTLKPCQEELSRLLGIKVVMAPAIVGKEVKGLVDGLKGGDVLLLENLRFNPAEEKPELDPGFAKELASYGDFYVDDAFGCAHRAHSSIVEVPKLLPGKSAAGFLLEKEVNFLSGALKDPKKPFIAIIGGAKVSSKIGVLKALLDKVDVLLIGGAMAFTFLKSKGLEVGDSLVENDFVKEAGEILSWANKKGVSLILPKDFVVAKEVKTGSSNHIVSANTIPPGMKGVDIGPDTTVEFISKMESAKTIFWNGPMGVFEISPFERGTRAIAEAFVSSKAVRIAGGGETVAALQSVPGYNKIDHLSTGGGASLELIEFGTLPGIDILSCPVAAREV